MSRDAQRDDAASPRDLAAELDELYAIRAQAAKLEKRAREIRDRVVEAMTRSGADVTRSAQGRVASLSTHVRWHADREEASRLLSPEVFHAIFQPTQSVILRVK